MLNNWGGYDELKLFLLLIQQKTIKKMKNNTVLLMGILCLLLAYPLHAQFSMESGLHAQSAMRYVTYSNDSTGLNFGKTTPNIGVSADISIGYHFSEKTSLFSGLRYDQFGYTQRSLRDNSLFWFYTHHIGIPIDFRYKFSENLQWNLGVTGTYLLRQNTAPEVWGIYGQTGIGFCFQKFTLQLQYKHFISPYFVYSYDDPQFSHITTYHRHHAFTLGLSYRFWESKKGA